MSSAFPLHWPENWPRTPAPMKSQFKTSLSGALKNVQDSLKRFHADSGKECKEVLISSNVTLGAQNPKDSGVAIYFTWDGINTCIAVDRYAKVEENLQAIHHVIEAERVKLRHGGLNLVRAAFRGYVALPPPSSSKDAHWSEVLKVPRTASIQDIDKAYRERAREIGPNDSQKMLRLNLARDKARMDKNG